MSFRTRILLLLFFYMSFFVSLIQQKNNNINLILLSHIAQNKYLFAFSGF